jgi:2-methylcitrate dehydratase PrpD
MTVSDLPQPVLGAIADFLVGLPETVIPDDVLHQGRRMLLDTIGCAIGGTRSTPAQPFLRYLESVGGAGPSSVLGTRLTASPTDAAYVNAYLADVLDYEETSVSHPSAVVVPAVLAAGQHSHSSGADVLRAAVAAYEIGARVGLAVAPSAALGREAASAFWWKSVAAAVGAGLLLGLNRDQWVHAIGYATATSPAARRGGFEFRPLNPLKANFPGQAHAGVAAAYLARNGFEMHRGMLDGPRHFGQLLGSDRWQPERITEGLGDQWMLAGAGFKAYPACLYLHPMLDAIAEARAGQSFGTGDIATVEVSVPALIIDEFDDRNPYSVVDAQYSAPFTAATLLLDPQPSSGWITDRRLADPEIASLMSRVSLIESPEFTRAFAVDGRVRTRVRIGLDDGHWHEGQVDAIHGSVALPLTDRALETKFDDATGQTLDESARRSIIALVSEVESVNDIDDLMRCTVPLA